VIAGHGSKPDTRALLADQRQLGGNRCKADLEPEVSFRLPLCEISVMNKAAQKSTSQIDLQLPEM
jgi:hypothetical protein